MPNGGKPFSAIRTQLHQNYGTPIHRLQLVTPPNTNRAFTIEITNIAYRGTVTGAIIDANKINPVQDAIYFYPITEGINVIDFQDFPCEPD